jgi:hypothetical protein
VILFTTFSNRSDKLFVYENTIRNWAAFLPHIQPVLFTTFPHGPVVDLARKHAWLVAPNPTVNIFGSPVLKDMYLAAIANKNLFGEATLYGYANGDILFDSGLNETLTKVMENIEFLNTTLLFGIRRNYQLLSESNYTDDPLWPPGKIGRLGNDNYTTLFRFDAFDYFFVTRDFPFDRFLPLVIGRSGFDTYFAALANVANLSTIEGTGTITALHQTDQDGNFAHNKPMNQTDKSYNRILLGNYKLSNGFASRARYGSTRTRDGAVVLKYRHPIECIIIEISALLLGFFVLLLCAIRFFYIHFAKIIVL